jgi:hypothetical protein
MSSRHRRPRHGHGRRRHGRRSPEGRRPGGPRRGPHGRRPPWDKASRKATPCSASTPATPPPGEAARAAILAAITIGEVPAPPPTRSTRGSADAARLPRRHGLGRLRRRPRRERLLQRRHPRHWRQHARPHRAGLRRRAGRGGPHGPAARLPNLDALGLGAAIRLASGDDDARPRHGARRPLGRRDRGRRGARIHPPATGNSRACPVPWDWHYFPERVDLSFPARPRRRGLPASRVPTASSATGTPPAPSSSTKRAEAHLSDTLAHLLHLSRQRLPDRRARGGVRPRSPPDPLPQRLAPTLHAMKRRPRHRAPLRRRTGRLPPHRQPATTTPSLRPAPTLCDWVSPRRPPGPRHRQDRRHLLDARHHRNVVKGTDAELMEHLVRATVRRPEDGSPSPSPTSSNSTASTATGATFRGLRPRARMVRRADSPA